MPSVCNEIVLRVYFSCVFFWSLSLLLFYLLAISLRRCLTALHCPKLVVVQYVIVIHVNEQLIVDSLFVFYAEYLLPKAVGIFKYILG